MINFKLYNKRQPMRVVFFVSENFLTVFLYDDKIIKPEDWEREYVQQSLSALYSSLSIK